MPARTAGAYTPLLDLGVSTDGNPVFRAGLGGVEWVNNGYEQALVNMPGGELLGIRNI